jgi:general secretion pathway protein D
LKASVHLLTGCVALGLTLPAIISQAAVPTTAGVAIALAATGQQGQADPRRQADELLRQARKAIKDGAYDQADGLIRQAEQTGVKYDALTARFVDTPEKLRKLLNDERAKASGSQKPSSRFPALLGGNSQPQATPQQAIPSDPFQGQQARTDVVNRLTDDPKSKAVGLLREARFALQNNDRIAATAAYQKALGMNATFGPDEDSPQRLAADLQAMGVDVSRLSPAPSSPAASPYALRPSDIDTSTDRLPLLQSGTPSGVPAAIPVGAPNPYNLQGGGNPLDVQPVSAPPPQGARAGGQFQPLDAGGYTAAPANVSPEKAEVQRLIAEGRLALEKGDLATAHRLSEQAQRMNVPESAFGPEETRPWQLALEVQKMAVRRQGVTPAGGTAPVGNDPRYPVTQGGYNPAMDTSRVQPASSQVTFDAQPGNSSAAQRLYEEGLRALDNQDRATALQKFREAWALQEELDPETLRQLKDKLTFLNAPAGGMAPQPLGGGPASPLQQVTSEQELLRQKLMREIANEQKSAEKLAATDPRAALGNLRKVRERVATADVGAPAQKQLLTLVDKSIIELEKYIEQNKSAIENEERNNQIRAERVREQELTIETQNKLAELVEEFNTLLDERRYAEAEVIAKKAREIAPDYPTVTLMVEKSKLARNVAAEGSISERTRDGVIDVMTSIGESGIPFDDRTPYLMGDARKWADLTRDRRRLLQERTNLSPAEMEIQRSLSKPVEARFESRPLQEVLDTLGRMTGINVYLDPQGMHAEGVSSDTPVTLNLSQPISLKSALTLILEPLRLSYVIQNEVLRITSAQTRDSNTYAKVYYVADLVVPIPNFVPSYNMGLPGALKESLNSLGYGNGIRPSMSGPLTIAADDPANQQPGVVNPTILAQQQMQGSPISAISGLGGTRGPQSLASGPGGLGGGVTADFDPLIELITTTIAPQSWDEVGGPGSISGFDTNLSLVVSQTQDVHEKIADLLEQLRRLQDLQVTIEVRFITLSDRFFERIGVDFDFAVDDNTGLNNVIDLLPGQAVNNTFAGNTPFPSPYDDSGPSLTFGLTPTGPTADLDFAFNQGSNGVTPAFGGFDANSAATFGFAILSDIEVFFLLNAAQGDDRTNVLQAPKVTLFNGQQAFVSDTSQRPFVTSVIPVVGDFAAAHQPVIVVLSEGTSLSVQAVVSSDRRFVRLTLVPFFSQIGDVETFTFNGKVTTDTGTTTQDPSDPDANVVNNATRTVEGTTVQLPTFAFTTVVTTVSVPDGGTVLLGGIKRLREGRVERGVPLLSKIPYVSRLFRNVAIGRDAQSLMMMVTPRIIIQEEEEEKLGIQLEE